MTSHLTTDRIFRFYEYTVSHDQLVIRSRLDDSHGHNIDLHFKGVAYLECPTLLRGLQVVEPLESEVQYVRDALGDLSIDPDRILVLESGGSRYLIVAASFVISENTLPSLQTEITRQR